MALLTLFAAGVLALVFPSTVSAAGAWCAYVPCGAHGGPNGVSAYLLEIGLKLAGMMTGLVMGYLLITAFTMVTESAGEGTSKGKQSLLSIAIGCIVVALAWTLMLAFGIGSGNTSLLVPELTKIVVFFKGVLYIALVANIVLQGFRLITSQGDSGQTDKARQRLFVSFIGTGIVLLASSIITVAQGGWQTGIDETVGIANFLITLFGALAVIAILVGGILLVVSVDEGLKDKAKAAVRVAIISLIIVMFSAAIIRFFFTNTPQIT